VDLILRIPQELKHTHMAAPSAPSILCRYKMKLILSVNIYINVPERYFIFVIFKARIDIIKVQGAKHTAQRSHPSFLMPSPLSRTR
jgi:hypothetical protein